MEWQGSEAFNLHLKLLPCFQRIPLSTMNSACRDKHWLKECFSCAWIRVLLFFCVSIFINMRVSAENRRPIYIVAHMVNSVYELDEYLARGANAIEADLMFNKNGTIQNIYHGYPCDCFRVCDERENFATYLNYVRDLANPNHENYQKSLTLLFLDLKLSDVSQKYRAGEEIAKHLITHLWNADLSDPRISVLLSIGHTFDSDTIRGVQDTFTKSNRGSALKRLGFDVGLNDDLNSIIRMWTKLGVKANRWQGDGITNCLRMFRDDKRLRQAIRIRDRIESNISFEKVYDWTVDTTANIRSSLRNGVDAIITNFPERVLSVLQEKEFKNGYRIATTSDNPFSRVHLTPVKSNLPGPSLNTYVSTVREITINLMGYFWDFYKLRLKRPGTLFPLIEEFFGRALITAMRRHRALLK